MTGMYGAANSKGLVVPIDINNLIETIFVNPGADQTLVEVLNGLKASFALNASIIKSNVNSGPAY